MKIIVIGSKGFIGSHLISSLRIMGHDTWGCDVLMDYEDKMYFPIDVSNSDYEQVFNAQQYDVCINVSGSASVPDSILNPTRDYFLNTSNVFKILEGIRKYNSNCKFINLSSAAVYGNPKELPIKETHSVTPLSPYGWHKYQSEILCTEFNQVYNLKTCSLRIFSAYGPGLKKQLFWDWYQKTLNSNTLTVYGTGNESRDFIYISDLIAAIHCTMESDHFQGDVCNIANGTEVSIKNAIEVFHRIRNKSFSYTFNQETRKGDPINWKADISKLKSLGYQQKISFEEGLQKYLTWLNDRK